MAVPPSEGVVEAVSGGLRRGRLEWQRREAERGVVDRKPRRQRAGGAGVRAGDGGEGGRDAELAGAAGAVAGGRHHGDANVARGVPLTGVEVIIPTSLQGDAARYVQAGGKGERDAILHAADHLRLKAARVDREPGIDDD